jgi:hypothetical protein
VTDRINVVRNSPNTRFALEADVLSQNVGLRQTTVRCYLRANNGPSGNTTSRFLDAGSQAGAIDGISGNFAVHSGDPFLPAGYAQNAQRWRNGPYDVVLQHDANGYWRGGTVATVKMALNYGSIHETLTGTLTIPRIAVTPGAPRNLKTVPNSVTPTTFQVQWDAPSSPGGSAIDSYQLQFSTVSTFASTVANITAATSPEPPGVTLTSGINYYVRVRAHNAQGYGPWSPTLTQATFPSGAAGIKVTPDPLGTFATAAATPPGGVSGATQYTIEHRESPSGTVTSTTQVASSLRVDGLVPGEAYDWRASAWYGAYQSPFSSWLTVTQPRPTMEPIVYFDGDTPADLNTKFSWLGDRQGSTSAAVGVEPLGWKLFDAAGGEGFIERVTTTLPYNTFSARVTMTHDATGPGVEAGISDAGGFFAYVLADAEYFGAITVYSPRTQRFVTKIRWYNASFGFIGEELGTEFVVEGESFERVPVTGAVPTNGYAAVVTVMDVAGTDHSNWLGGEWFVLDAADFGLIPVRQFFDGSFPAESGFSYAWSETPNNSISVRSLAPIIAPPDPLIDPDCDPIPAPPRPPVISDPCIIEQGAWRRWWATIPASEVSDWLTVVPTIELGTDAAPARQVRIRYYPNPDNLVPEDMDYGSFVAEQIVTYIPGDTLMTLDGVSQHAWADVLGTGPRSADHLLYGTGGSPATWPEFTCGMAYMISFDLPVESAADSFVVSRLLLTQKG